MPEMPYASESSMLRSMLGKKEEQLLSTYYVKGCSLRDFETLAKGFHRLHLKDKAEKKPLSLHFCLLDKECRDLSLPMRIYAQSPKWKLVLALGKNGKVLSYKKGEFVSTWLSLAPQEDNMCCNIVGINIVGINMADISTADISTIDIKKKQMGDVFYLESLRTCPLKINHKGKCVDHLRGKVTNVQVKTKLDF